MAKKGKNNKEQIEVIEEIAAGNINEYGEGTFIHLKVLKSILNSFKKVL